jgi:predicted Ser/Thr protein kinase
MMPPHGSTNPFHWLRLAIVHEHAGYRDLVAQLASPAAAAWLGDQLGPRHADDHPQGPAAALLASLQRDLRACAADPAAPVEVDPLLREEVLAAIADLAPPEHEAWARAALQAFAPTLPTSAAPRLAAAPQQRVGSYELRGLIGHGSSSAVYEGRHIDNGMRAAVKLLRLETADTESVVRFRTEAKIAGRLRHPAIAQILDSGVELRGGSTVPYLVYAFAEGSPFATALARAEPDRIVRVFGVLCEAIAHAHRHGVLHRDLKSANVLVDAADRVAVLDFGIARLLDGGAIRQTHAGQVLGTLQTMSPEQAAGIAVDARSDV